MSILYIGIPLFQSFNLLYPLRLNSNPSPVFSVYRVSGYKGPYTLLNPPSQLDNMPTEH